MSDWKNIWIVFQREYLSRVRKKSFILMSLIGPLVMAGVAIAAIYMSIEEPENQRVLVVDENYPLFDELRSSKMIQFDVKNVTLDEGLSMLKDSDYTAVLHVYKNYYKIHSGALYFKRQPSFRIQREIEEAVRQHGEIQLLGEFEISESDYLRIKTPFEMLTFKFNGDQMNSEQTDYTPAVVGIVFSVLIYMFIFMYSVQVMRGVIEEKNSRIIEIMISSVKPFQLMMGKIVGVAAVGLTQFLIWVFLTGSLIGVGQLAIMGKYQSDKIPDEVVMTDEIQKQMANPEMGPNLKLSDESSLVNQLSRVNFPLMIGLFIFYFVGGYLLYSAMMAAVGSAVDNDTDTQQFILPITFPLLLSYIGSFVIFNNPSSPLAVWMSIIPFTSPVTMLVRVSFGIESGDLWQVWLSMALLVITFVGMVWVASKVYRTGILMYGQKPSFGTIIKWMKYK